RPAAAAADATGIYIAGSVQSAEDVRMRRWAVIKLDASGAVAWSAIEELPRSPAPERILLANGAVVVAGQDEQHEAARLLVIERRDAATGKRTWQRRFTARDAKCTTPGCAGKDTFGGIALRGNSVLFNATVDRPLEHAFGELSLDKGTPAKRQVERSDLRAHDIAGDDTGMYLLEANLSKEPSLLKIGAEKIAWTHKVDGERLALAPGALLLWGKTIEKRSPETGEIAWASKLAGDHIDVTVDGSGIYATAMIDAKPSAYFGLAKIDAASGAVQWVRKTSGYEENRPSAYVASDGKDAVYVVGVDGDKLYVERRRKIDGALGEVQTTGRTIESKAKRK
ncbi:MAG TPA: PQQ-binding-like beta-propeller repeat protein, partial [Kofleriaceae bacterium]